MSEFEREKAIALAQQQLRNVLNSGVRDPDPVEKYQSFLQNDRSEYLPSGRLLDLQRQAVGGSISEQAIHDEIVLYGAAFLRQGEQPPPWLAKYIADVLEGNRQRPSKVGRKRRSTQRRDFALWLAVDVIVRQYGLQAYSKTHGDAEIADTACSLVAEAARLEGHGIGSTNVARVWKRFHDVTEETFGLG